MMKITLQMPVDAVWRLFRLLKSQTPEGEAARKELGIEDAELVNVERELPPEPERRFSDATERVRWANRLRITEAEPE